MLRFFFRCLQCLGCILRPPFFSPDVAAGLVVLRAAARGARSSLCFHYRSGGPAVNEFLDLGVNSEFSKLLSPPRMETLSLFYSAVLRSASCP